MALKQIDQTTLYPNGKVGVPARAAFAVSNENFAETEQRLTDEVTARAEADATLGLRVDLVEGSIAAEVDALEAAIEAESVARLGAITQETDARVEAQEVLAARIGDVLAKTGRNRLINGDFRFWYRRDNYIQGGGGQGYAADRWYVAAIGCTHTATHASFGPGTGPRPELKNYHQCTVASATASSAAWIGQHVESVYTLADQYATLSGLVFGPADCKVGVRIIQNFGNGGTPSPVVTTEMGLVEVGPTSWSYFQLTKKIPALDGKTLGTDGKDSLHVVIDLCGTGYDGAIAGQNGVFGLTLLQLEGGTDATGYEWRDDATELMRCQRYYWESEPFAAGSNYMDTPTFIVPNGSLARAVGYNRFPVPMRAKPALSTFNPNNSAMNSMHCLGTDNPVYSSIDYDRNATTQINFPTNRIAGQVMICRVRADAEF